MAKNQPVVKQPHSAGRPTKYIEEYAEQARKLCELGATNADLAAFFNVHVTTIDEWMVRHQEFSGAIKMSKGSADDVMERSLYMKGRGFWIDTEKVYCNADGDVTRVNVREYYPPDTAAAFIWLKNRRPEVWRDRHASPLTDENGDPYEFTVKIGHVGPDGSKTAAEVRISPAVAVPEAGGGDLRPEGLNGGSGTLQLHRSRDKNGENGR